MSTLPIGLFWALGLWGFFSRKPILLYLFFCSMPFGSVAVLPPGLTAGLTFTPTPIIALLLIARSLVNRRGLTFTLTSALMPRRLALLFLFWVVATFTTIFMPRLFEGEVYVIPVRGNLGGSSLLYPTPQNMSQLAYLTISIFTVFAFARILQSDYMRWHALRAMAMGGAVVVASGLLDFATQFLPIRPFLDPFRTATYALLTDVEVLGGKRVIGLMPEASSYGGLCLTFLASLYFFRHAIDDPVLRDRYVPALLALLVFLLWQSTSSSAYVGVAVFGLCAVLDWCWRASSRPNGKRDQRIIALEFWVAFAGLVALIVVIIFNPALLDPILATVDRMVLQKTSSLSYEERNMWTAVSWQAALDSYGLGVGMGATRPSNTFVAVVSSTGFIGGIFYYGFVISMLMRRSPVDEAAGRAMLSAARWSFVPIFVIGLLAGTLADFGLFVAFLFGFIAALSRLNSPAGVGAYKRSRGMVVS